MLVIFSCLVSFCWAKSRVRFILQSMIGSVADGFFNRLSLLARRLPLKNSEYDMIGIMLSLSRHWLEKSVDECMEA